MVSIFVPVRVIVVSVPARPEAPTAPEEKEPAPEDYTCRHIHNSKMLDKVSRDVKDQATFIVWPLNIPVRQNVTMTEIAVYAKYEDDEQFFVSESTTNPIVAVEFLNIPGVTFSVRGSYENGKFESTVIPVWEGVQLYDFSDDVERIEPEPSTDRADRYMKQFRFQAGGFTFYNFPVGGQEDPTVTVICSRNGRQCELNNDYLNLVLDQKGTTVTIRNTWKQGVLCTDFQKKR